MKKTLNRILTIILLLLIPALYGCRSYHSDQENENIEEIAKEGTMAETEDKNVEETESQVQDSYEPINYMALEKEGHKILSENICMNPKSVYEDSWLLEQLENELRLDRKMMEDFGTPESVIEYFLFDLNGDGVDEYIVSLCGSGWNGSAGNAVIFLSRNEDGKSDRIFSVTAQLAGGGKYWPIAVLDEKTDGYYSLVLPWSDGNRIWKYSEEEQRYDSD